MIAFAALLLAFVQAKPPTITAEVDRKRLAVGEECVLTVRVTSTDIRTASITMPTLQGFVLRSRIERTEPATDGTDAVTTTLELTLRAIDPGRWPLGPVRATQGGVVASTPALTVDVTAAPDLLATTPNPRLRALLQHVAPPTKVGDVALRLLVSADSARIGEQVDVLAAAWFPRELRLQLRRPPVLQPPVIGGVWSLAQAAPGGLATSRLIGGEWYDLFISHQTIFPLAAGKVVIPAATLRYAVPVALQFLSQEESYELSDGPRSLTVLPLPSAGRPAGFAGAVGHGIVLERHVGSAAVEVGDAVPVEIEVHGEGNVSLWPAPAITWPSDVRAYPDNTEDHPGLVNGRVGGDKRFRFIVVPSRPGAVTLPALTYDYFDPTTNRFEQATLAAGSLPVRAGLARSKEPPLPLLPAAGQPWPARFAATIPPALIAGGLALFPIAALAMRRRPRRTAVVAAPMLDPVHRLERLIIEVAGGNRDIPLGIRLRAAGIDGASATRLLAFLDALTAARYGPDGRGIDAGLTSEATKLVGVLEPISKRRRTRGRTASGALLILVLGAAAIRAVAAPSAESLYRSGAFASAAEGFARDASAAPRDPALWYNLAAARIAQGGEDVAAMVALTRARRLAPRDPTIRAAERRIASIAGDPTGVRWVSPVTAAELLIVGGLFWVVAWVCVGFNVRWSRLALPLVVGVLMLGGAIGVSWWYSRAFAIVREATTLRAIPHGRGDALGEVPVGATVTVRDSRGPWRLTATDDGRTGWILAETLSTLAP